MNCSGCGAALDPNAEICSYCRAPTAHAAQVRAQREAAQRYQAQQQWAYQQVGKLSAHGEAQKLGTTSILWALVGLVPCFFLIPNVVSIVYAVKAHAAAKRAQASMPGSAIGGVVLSSLWIVLLPLAMVMGQLDENKRAERVKAIDDELSGELDGATVDLDTICLLTEKQVIEEGHAGRKNLKKVDCSLAKTRPIPDGLEVEGVRITYTTGEPDKVFVCLKKGARWAVDATSATGCTAPASASSASSAVPGAEATSVKAATADATASATAQPTARPGRR